MFSRAGAPVASPVLTSEVSAVATFKGHKGQRKLTLVAVAGDQVEVADRLKPPGRKCYRDRRPWVTRSRIGLTAPKSISKSGPCITTVS